VVSDSSQYLLALTKALGPDAAKVDADWIATATGLKKLPSGYENEPEDSSPQRIHPWHGIKRVFSSLDPGCILVIDGGECSSWSAELQEYAKPFLTLFALGHLGFLGNGYGYAIGAAVAEPSRQVVMMQGDGSAGFHFAELETFSRHNLNILSVIANNYIWAMSQHGQDLMWADKNTARPVTSLNPNTKFEVAAQGFGNAGEKVNKFADIESTVKRLSKESTPALLNLIIDAQPIHPGTAAMINPTDDPDVVVVPYYDNLPRPVFKNT
jgi:thiamine pyrophosphate-dependent acetolactate synthase large subunit-like protein